MSDSGSKRNPLRSCAGKGRRATRKALLGGSGAVGEERLEELWHWVNGMQQAVNRIGAQVGDISQRTDTYSNETSEHVDLVVDQLWRRLEAADARLAKQYS